jgi:hypothetical protein
VDSGIGVFFFLGREVITTPTGKFTELAGWGQADIARDVQLDAGRQRQAPPQLSWRRNVDVGRLAKNVGPRNPVMEATSNLFERMAGFLERLHAEELIEVLAAVVVPPAHAEWRGKEAFPNVVADRTPRHSTEIGKVPDGVTRLVGHDELNI